MSKIKGLVVSLPWFTVLVAAYFSGWIEKIYVGDSSYISVLIAILSIATIHGALLGRVSAKNLDFMGNMAVTLGLIGTVFGFIQSLLSVDPSAVTDVNNISPMVASLISGMGVALYTTLVGSFFFLWIATLQRVVESHE